MIITISRSISKQCVIHELSSNNVRECIVTLKVKLRYESENFGRDRNQTKHKQSRIVSNVSRAQV